MQYLIWLKNIAQGDFGKSIVAKRPVKSVILDKLPATLKLGAVAWLIAFVGIPMGMISAVRRGGTFDYLVRGFSILGQALPSFWVGIVAILIFAVGLGWLPSSGRGDNWQEFILPSLTLGWLPLAAYVRLTRSSMLDVLDSEYVTFARAKGVGFWTVIAKHAMKNAIISPLTFSGLLLAGFITGSVVVETVFSWPGIGRLAITAVFDNDFPVLSIVVLLFTVMYVSTNLIIDVLYAVIDPRIRLS
jgi:peptide/nickel transport system permease protein